MSLLQTRSGLLLAVKIGQDFAEECLSDFACRSGSLNEPVEWSYLSTSIASFQPWRTSCRDGTYLWRWTHLVGYGCNCRKDRSVVPWRKEREPLQWRHRRKSPTPSGTSRHGRLSPSGRSCKETAFLQFQRQLWNRDGAYLKISTLSSVWTYSPWSMTETSSPLTVIPMSPGPLGVNSTSCPPMKTLAAKGMPDAFLVKTA